MSHRIRQIVFSSVTVQRNDGLWLLLLSRLVFYIYPDRLYMHPKSRQISHYFGCFFPPAALFLRSSPGLGAVGMRGGWGGGSSLFGLCFHIQLIIVAEVAT